MTRRERSPDEASDTPSGRASDGQVHGRLDVAGSDLLDFGQLIIAGMKTTTGDGEPDYGAQFGHGRDAFTKISATLRAAAPDDRWEGAGSRAYADQNTRQQLRTETLADADQAVHSVLIREARQIRLRRKTFDDTSDFLAKTGYATSPLQFIPRYGEAARLAIETVALQAAISESANALYQLHSEVSANAAELSQAVGRYAGVADGADAPGGEFDPPAPPGGGGAAGALASVVGPLAGLVTGGALAAGQAAAGLRDQVHDAQGADVEEAMGKAEEDRDGDPRDQIGEAGDVAAGRAPVGAEAGPAPTGPPAPLTDSVNPQDTKLGEGVDGGG